MYDPCTEQHTRKFDERKNPSAVFHDTTFYLSDEGLYVGVIYRRKIIPNEFECCLRPHFIFFSFFSYLPKDSLVICCRTGGNRDDVLEIQAQTKCVLAMGARAGTTRSIEIQLIAVLCKCIHCGADAPVSAPAQTLHGAHSVPFHFGGLKCTNRFNAYDYNGRAHTISQQKRRKKIG